MVKIPAALLLVSAAALALVLWVLDGFDVDVGFQRVTGVRFMEHADHCVLRNSRVHNSTSGASVYVSGRDILVEGCEIFNNFQTNGQDSHGVAIVQAAARVMVRRSRLWDNGGDGIQCEDYAEASAPAAAFRSGGEMTAVPSSSRWSSAAT